MCIRDRAHDVGRAINPDIVEGQIHGSVLQGIGYALSEQIVYDKKARQAQDLSLIHI